MKTLSAIALSAALSIALMACSGTNNKTDKTDVIDQKTTTTPSKKTAEVTPGKAMVGGDKRLWPTETFFVEYVFTGLRRGNFDILAQCYRPSSIDLEEHKEDFEGFKKLLKSDDKEAVARDKKKLLDLGIENPETMTLEYFAAKRSFWLYQNWIYKDFSEGLKKLAKWTLPNEELNMDGVREYIAKGPYGGGIELKIGKGKAVGDYYVHALNVDLWPKKER